MFFRSPKPFSLLSRLTRSNIISLSFLSVFLALYLLSLFVYLLMLQSRLEDRIREDPRKNAVNNIYLTISLATIVFDYCINTDRYTYLRRFYVASPASSISSVLFILSLLVFILCLFIYTFLVSFLYLYIYICISLFYFCLLHVASTSAFRFLFVSPHFCLFSLRHKYIFRLRIFNSQNDLITQLCSFASFFIYALLLFLFLSFSFTITLLFLVCFAFSHQMHSFPFALSMYINYSYLVS